MCQRKQRIEGIREQNLADIPDEPCPCGKPQPRDLFGIPWPDCLYFDDRSLCEPACAVVVGDIDTVCGKRPASPIPETVGADFDFPMCAEHQQLFRKGHQQ